MEVKIGSNSDHLAYGYFCLDLTMQNEARYKLSEEAIDENMSGVEVHEKFKTKGLFMIVATRRIAKTKILNLYFSRNQIEEIFKIGKTDGNMLPLNVSNENTLRGHLIITFIAAVIIKILNDRLLNQKISINKLFSTLEYQSANIYRDKLITSEPTKIMNEIYDIFKIKCPVEIPYKPTEDELKRL